MYIHPHSRVNKQNIQLNVLYQIKQIFSTQFGNILEKKLYYLFFRILAFV